MTTDETTETKRFTADTALFADDGNRIRHVLLMRRGKDPYKGYLALPGGHVEPGEDPLDAAWRELAEETGLRIATTLQPCGVYATPGRDPRGRVSFAYTAVVPSLLDVTAGDDAVEALWMRIDQALADDTLLAFDHRQIITDALKIAEQLVF